MRTLLGLVAAFVLSVCGFGAWAQTGAGHDSAGHVTAPPPLGALADEISLRDGQGRVFTNEDLHGRWSLVYFGYSRCRTACPIALPTIRDAAFALETRSLNARAVFIDIEAGPQPLHLRIAASAEPAGHAAHSGAEIAMAELARQFPSVAFLTGGRAQIRRAVQVFHVRSEHIPARTQLGEQGHSINHTALIYVLDPAGAIVAHVDHNVAPAALVALVESRARMAR